MPWLKKILAPRRDSILQWRPLESIWVDVRFAFRQLRKSPGFAVTTILTLSLGIAATTAIFGLVDSALIRPLPYPNPSQLVAVGEISPRVGQGMGGYSYLNYVDLERSNRVFASLAAFQGTGFILSDKGGLLTVNGIGVTPNFFRILGVTPILGKDFDPNPDGEDLQSVPSTVILSYAAWQKWFGGRPEVLGKTVTLTTEKVPYTVIGVLPRSFQFDRAGVSDFWTTLRPYASDPCSSSRGCTTFSVIARLKDGITVQQALADVRAMAARESRLHPDPDKYRSASVVPLSKWILGDIQPILLALLAGVALLLLTAYVNVAGLLLVRSENRRHEFAVRGVLGAGPGRLAQQFVIEGLVIVAISSGLGLFAATFARQLLLKLIPADVLDSMPSLRGGWNWHLTVFSTALVLIALILFAVTPAFRIPFANLRAGLTQGSGGTLRTAWRRLGAKLVILEIAATMVLLAGAGLLGKSLYRLLRVDVGFVPDHLATLWMMAPETKYANRAQALAFQKGIVSRLQSLPGVTAAGIVSDLPLGGDGGTQIGFVGRPNLGVNNEVGHVQIGAEYLSVLKARLLKGRYFNEHDDAAAPLVAIINQSLARQYFADENPVGKQIFFHAHDVKLEALQPPIQIVGVVADIKQNSLDERQRPDVYTPFAQSPSAGFSIAVRASQQPASVLPSLIVAIHDFDPEILTGGAATMPELIQSSWAAYLHRVLASLAGGLAVLALLLSAVGLYGVIAYSVSRRTCEIGLRMALGATRGSVYQLILKEAGRLTLMGLVIGLCGSLAAGIFLRGLLFGVHSWDVSILCAVAAVLVASALLASYLPARRAARVNPIVALRHE
jgi:macrolide transport system ATP-binding/permease protein